MLYLKMRVLASSLSFRISPRILTISVFRYYSLSRRVHSSDRDSSLALHSFPQSWRRVCSTW
jgi:hypothetical protein